MANENVFGGRFEIDVSSARHALNDARRTIALVNSEFASTTAGLDATADASDITTAKIQQLTDKIKIQEQVVGALENQYQEMVETYGENSKEAQNAQIELNKWNTQLKGNQKNLKNAEKSLEELNNTTEDNAKVTDQASEAQNGFGKVLGGVAKGIAGAVVAVAGLAGGFLALAESTREYRTEMGKLETAFVSAGLEGDKAQKTYSELNAVLNDSGKATEATQQLAELVNSEKDLDTWTNILTGVYGKFGDSLPVESLAEASNETAKVGKVTGALADALNWVGYSEDEFNEKLASLNTEQERSQLITDTLNGLYSESAETYKELNKDVLDANRAQENLNASMAELGAIAEPITTFLKNGLATVLQIITPYIQELVEGLKLLVGGEIQSGLETLGTLFDNIHTKISELIVNGLNIISEKLPEILPMIGNILMEIINKIIGFLPSLLEVASQLILAIADAIPPLANSIIQKLPVVIQNILSLIGEWIPKIFELAGKLWNKIVEALPGLIRNLVQNLPKIIQSIIDFFVNNSPKIYEGALNLLRNIVKSLPTIITELVKGIGDLVGSIIKTLWNNKDKIWNAGKEMFGTFLKNIPEIGKDLVKGLWNGIKDMAGWIGDKISGFGEGILTDLKDFFGIKSPSVVLEKEVGEYLPLGMAKGIKNKIGAVKDALAQTVDVKGMQQEISATGGSVASGGRNITINQYITSPEPLNELTIYKQTKNASLLARGV